MKFSEAVMATALTVAAPETAEAQKQPEKKFKPTIELYGGELGDWSLEKRKSDLTYWIDTSRKEKSSDLKDKERELKTLLSSREKKGFLIEAIKELKAIDRARTVENSDIILTMESLDRDSMREYVETLVRIFSYTDKTIECSKDKLDIYTKFAEKYKKQFFRSCFSPSGGLTDIERQKLLKAAEMKYDLVSVFLAIIQSRIDIITSKTEDDYRKEAEKVFAKNEVYIEKLKIDIAVFKNELKNQEKYTTVEKIQEEMVAQLQKLYKRFSSGDYKKKLMIEGYTEEEARLIQKNRVDTLLNTRFIVGTLLESEYLYPNDTVFLAIKGLAESPNLVNHEAGHRVMRGIDDLSERNKLMLSETITQEEFNLLLEKYEEVLFDEGKFWYFSNEGEIDTRRILFSMEMEDLGVKKYGEKMTEAHYKKMWDLFHAGKLSRGAMQYILFMKASAVIRNENEMADTYFVTNKDFTV